MAKVEKPEKKSKAQSKLTDKERHERFLKTAREVGASDASEAFDHAFERVARRQ